MNSKKNTQTYKIPKLYLIGTPEHNNIGDAAIAIGEKIFLKKYFKKHQICEITVDNFFKNFKNIKKNINYNDLIFLHGGGNLGNRYINQELIRRNTIQSLPKNNIIIFSQTIFFSKNKEGKKELEVSKNIYNQHPGKIILFSRDKLSFKNAKKFFPKIKNYLMPDLALMINSNKNYKRNGVLACIRDVNDESGLTTKNYHQLQKIIDKLPTQINKSKNQHSTSITKNIRRHIVFNELNYFSKHQVIITDRLHGLIFSIITKTPCIVIKSLDHKINKFIKFFKGYQGIFYIGKNIKKIPLLYKKILKKNFKIIQINWDNKYFTKMYNLIIKEINNDQTNYFRNNSNIKLRKIY